MRTQVKPTWFIFHLVSSILASVFINLLPSPVCADDIEIIKSRLIEHYINTLPRTGAGFHLSQKVNGDWDDIDYDDQISSDRWEPIKHLERIRAMSVAYKTRGNVYYNSPKMRDGILAGINFWLNRKPKKPLKFIIDSTSCADASGICADNWWWNQIGQQRLLAPILLIMADQLTASQLSTGSSYILRQQDVLDRFQKGQNKVWFGALQIQRGCLASNEVDVFLGFEAIQSVIQIGVNEGIQRDLSFHQHGPQLYNAGYGLAFISDAIFWAYKARETKYRFSATKINILSNLLLDGHRWMIRGNTMDYSAAGRQISRPNQSARSIIANCERLATLDRTRAQELNLLKSHIEGDTGPPLRGNKYFWRGGLMTHHRQGFYTSVKVLPDNLIGTERMNKENLKGFWLPFGLTYFFRDGNEYRNIFPVWDWAKLPGVTNPNVVPMHPPIEDTYYQEQKGAIAGGVTDGNFGVATMRLNRILAQAHKAWFYFDQEMIALGSGISSRLPVNTTINQCILNGVVLVDGNDVDRGSHHLSSPKWIYHDGIVYTLPSGANVKLQISSHSGSWYDINRGQKTDLKSHDIFKVWIEHGAFTRNATYQYSVIPNISQDEVPSYLQDNAIRVIANSTHQQAVRHDRLGVTGIVFHHPGSVIIQEGQSVTVDKPCLALIHESEDRIRVAVSNPLSRPLIVHAKLSTKGIANNLRFNLPDGDRAGSSVIQTIDKQGQELWYNPTDDSYIRGGGYRDANYGNSSSLLVKKGSGEFDRKSFLKFAIGDNPLGYILNAKLRLYSHSLWSGETEVTIYGAQDAWSEAEIIYNDSPNLGTALQKSSVDAVGDYYEWDVTPYVRREIISGERELTFAVYTDEPNGVEFSSSESIHKPELILLYPIAEWYSRSDWSATQHLQRLTSRQISMEFDVVPLDENIDGVIGYTNRALQIRNWSDMAVLVRMNANGEFDVRDGSTYSADMPVNYIANASYHFRITCDLDSKTYNVWVTPDGSHTTQIAQNYAFRTDAPRIEYFGKVCLSSPNGNSMFKVENHRIAAQLP